MDEPVDDEGAQQVDLSLLVPENFSEIPYVNQINTKRRAMESFNQELLKLVNKQKMLNQTGSEGESVAKIKDYTPTLNIIVHMLEDPNMLVFIEAIKTIEYFSILCGKSVKQAKMKQFVQLLADKYKETKTAVLTQLEKTFDVIFEYKSMGQNQLIDQLIN